MSKLNLSPYSRISRDRLVTSFVAAIGTAIILSSFQQLPQVLAALAQDVNARVTAHDADQDKDGLTEQEEYFYGTDIRKIDTDGDGYADGHEIQQGYNPRGTGIMPAQGSTGARSAEWADKDQDGLSDNFEARLGLAVDDPDTDHDGHTDGAEIHRGFDPTGKGMLAVTLLVPRIGIQAPLIWSESEQEKDIERDLQHGVIHYPGTAIPGQEGNTFITGHSSDFVWQKGAYKDVFKNLPDLAPGDEVVFFISFANGRRQEIAYRLTEKLIVYPDDPRLFAPSPIPVITLVTCYPIGSNVQRIAWRGVMQ